MTQDEIKRSGIDLTGIQLINSCLNERSKKGHIVLEAPVNEFFEFRINPREQEKQMARVYFNRKSSIKKRFSKNPYLSGTVKQKCINAFDQEYLPEAIECVKLNGFIETLRIEHRANQQAVFLPNDSLDFSLKGKIKKTGGFDGIERLAYLKNEKADKHLMNRASKRGQTENDARKELISAFNPRGNEEMSFIIKERTKVSDQYRTGYSHSLGTPAILENHTINRNLIEIDRLRGN